jgi:hypothetical protein
MALKLCKKDLKRKRKTRSSPSPPSLLQSFEATVVDHITGDETTWGVADARRHAEAEVPPLWHTGLEDKKPSAQKAPRRGVVS